MIKDLEFVVWVFCCCWGFLFVFLFFTVGFPCLYITVICYRCLDTILIACQDFDDRIKSKERIIEKDQSRPQYNVKLLVTISSINSSHMNPFDTNRSIT